MIVMITASTPSLKASTRAVSDPAPLSGPLVSPNIIVLLLPPHR
jgi:hypothetical protein